MKRKQYEVMKNDLRVELSKLTISSGKLNTDLQEAKDDFELMCKSMSDRQDEFLTNGLLLEEKYGDSIAVLDGKAVAEEGEGSGENAVLPSAYADCIRRFVDDCANSLYNHGVMRKQELEEIEAVFEKYQQDWKKKIQELKERAEGIERQRGRLDYKLTNFNQFALSEVEEDEDEDSDSD